MIFKKQQGASTPLVLLFLAMMAVILTIAFKLYPAFYDHWQIESVVDSFNDELNLEEVSVEELSQRFNSRLIVNSIRDFDISENLFISKDDGILTIEVDYEVRVPVYRNIDAIMKFHKMTEKAYE